MQNQTNKTSQTNKQEDTTQRQQKTNTSKNARKTREGRLGPIESRWNGKPLKPIEAKQKPVVKSTQPIQRKTSQEDIKQNDQGSTTEVQLQEIDDKLLRLLYDIFSGVKQFTEDLVKIPLVKNLASMPFTAAANLIANELVKRSVKAGKSFKGEAVEKMKKYFIENVKKSRPDDCITCMRKGLDLVFGKKATRGSQIDKTMRHLRNTGKIESKKVIEFKDAKGKVTTGTRAPETLNESIWDKAIEMTKGDFGWILFGLSIMDGYHSVTLTVDHTRPAKPVMYWSDQISRNKGWNKMTKQKLDDKIVSNTKSWWKDHPAESKPKTRVTLWRIKP